MHTGCSEEMTIENCVFKKNYSTYAHGAGLHNNWKPVIKNCLFIDNYAGSGNGGGIATSGGKLTVINCTIVNNTASSYGGGVRSISSDEYINCIIWGNTASGNGQVSGNPTIRYSAVEGGYAGEGNISQDPLFVSGPKGTYYLSQTEAGQSYTSPCVNAGSDSAHNLGLDNLTTRTDGEPDQGIVDMGYHYEP